MKASKSCFVLTALLLFPVGLAAAAQFSGRTLPSKGGTGTCTATVLPVKPAPQDTKGTVFLLEYHKAFQEEEGCWTIPVQSLEQCMDTCKALEECRAFSFVKTGEAGSCLLLPDAGGAKVLRLSAISGMQWQD